MDNEPILCVPPVTACLLCLLALLQAAVSWWGLSPAPWLLVAADFWTAPFAHQLLTHAFFHASWLHWATNAGMLLAFGSAMERMVGPRTFLLAYAVFAVLSGFAQMLLTPTSTAMMLGASGAVCGVMGFVLWRMVRPRARRLQMAALFLLAQPVIAWAAGDLLGGNLAWAAHGAGFVAGAGWAALTQARFGGNLPS